MGDAARGAHRRRGTPADVGEQRGVRAAQGAVAGDVGDDVACTAGGVESLECLPEVTALLGPAASSQSGPTHVEADGDPVTVLGNDPLGPRGILQRRRAQVDSGGASGQGPSQRGVIPDASGELHLDADLADDA